MSDIGRWDMPEKIKERCLWCEKMKTRDEFILSTWKNRKYTCRECYNSEPCRKQFMEKKAERYNQTRGIQKGPVKRNKCLRCDRIFKTYNDYRVCPDCKQTNHYQYHSVFDPN